MRDPDVNWYPEGLTLQMIDGIFDNLTRAAEHFEGAWKKNVSKQGAVIPGKKKKVKGRKRPVQLRTPSAPGEFPHKFTGRLMRGIKSRVKRYKRYVGGRARVSVRGGNLTEFGTKNMAARPHLRATLAEEESVLAQILTTPVDFGGSK